MGRRGGHLAHDQHHANVSFPSKARRRWYVSSGTRSGLQGGMREEGSRSPILSHLQVHLHCCSEIRPLLCHRDDRVPFKQEHMKSILSSNVGECHRTVAHDKDSDGLGAITSEKRIGLRARLNGHL